MPMNDVLYAKEQVFEVPGCSLDGRPDERKVRVYVKGPTKGIGPKTRLLVNIHGAGGRQLDIEYKRFRHEISDAYDCLVVGVDFFGTLSRWIDVLYVTREKERIIESIRQHLSVFDPKAHINKDGNIYLESQKTWYCDSHFAASQLSLAAPIDAWDFGFIQALDILSALQVLLREWNKLSMPLPTIHFLSRSAGSQIAAMTVALCPHIACTVANIAPFMMANNHRGIAKILLTNPLGDPQSAHHGVMKIESEGVTTHVLRKSPVVFPLEIVGMPALEDHIEVRLMDNQALWKGIETQVEVISWRGCEDEHMPRVALESIHSCMSLAGASCRIVDITADRVDGISFINSHHELIRNTKTVFNHIVSDVLKGDRRPQCPELWAERKLPTQGGCWRIQWNPSPYFQFET